MSTKQAGYYGVNVPYSDRLLIKNLKAARSIKDLQEITGIHGPQRAYVKAKKEWHRLHGNGRESYGKEIEDGGIPGKKIEVGKTTYKIHGITHSGTEEERKFLKEHVAEMIDKDHDVYTEQGIRRMYFQDLDDVQEMDDYSWASKELRRRRNAEPENSDSSGSKLRIENLRSGLMRTAFKVITTGEKIYGRRIKRTMGGIASDFLTRPSNMGTGEDFISFTLNRKASRNPEKLEKLQNHYERTFLPQPVEREWLRNQSEVLELYTHSRNERITDYVLDVVGDPWKNDATVHVIAGAAHQPGILYYLNDYRHGFRDRETLKS
ncbi:MAG: hypothetical protein ABEK59_04245 [Halobacteria archaeon]